MLRGICHMGVPMTANFGFVPRSFRAAGMPDPATLPEADQGVLWRRTLAYFIDLCCIGVVVVLFWIAFAVLWVVSSRIVGAAIVVSVRADPPCLSHPTAERPSIGDLGNAMLRCRTALGDRRAPGVPAGAGADRSLLHHHWRDLLADPIVRAVQPAQAHPA